MRFSQSFLDEVRDRVPISDVIAQRVTWDKRKTNTGRGDYWACCPFHGEKTPSFHCEDRKGRYHCFGCGVSGDHFRFLTELDGMSFPEAVERVASMAGIPLPAPDPEAEKREKQRANLYDVMEMAAEFFETQLQMHDGAAARAYLRDRGLSQQTIAKFRLGYARNNRSALKEYLAQKGATKEQIEQCGLVVHGDDIPVSYDRFRDRIMFPIEDAQGRVIAFGGRAMSADVPAKYLNSPEGPLFHKSDVLYNFAKARSDAVKSGTLVAVEGYMDVIALDQAGIHNAVAPLGTALTESQLAKLWRVVDEPVLCFDGDQAGVRAAHRAVDIALPHLKPGKSLRFMQLPNSLDPDDLVAQRGKAGFVELLDSVLPLHEFLIDRRLASAALESPEQRAGFERSLYSDVDVISDDIVKRYYRSHIRLRLYEIFSRQRKGDRESRVSASSRSRVLEVSSTQQKLILGLCVEYPGIIEMYLEELAALKFTKNKYKKFMDALYMLYVDLGDMSVSKIYSELPNELYEVLDEVHGGTRVPPQTLVRFGASLASFVKRGHRLRALFPMLKFEPPMETIYQLVNHTLLTIRYRSLKEEFLGTPAKQAPGDISVEDYELVTERLIIMHKQLLESERELDVVFQTVANRQYHLVDVAA